MTARPGSVARRGRPGLLRLALVLALSGCANASERLHVEEPSSTWLGGGNPPTRSPSRTAFRLRFTRALNSEFEGADVPTEHAGVVLDPVHDLLYAGTSRGVLEALDTSGRRHASYDADSAIDATPVLDAEAGMLYVACGDGSIHALRTPTLERVWKESVGHPIGQMPVLTRDVLYVVSETDAVAAVSRADGVVLWTYRRPPAEEITIAGHAGLLRTDQRIVAAFNDGVVAALDPGDGSVLWEVDTAVDVEESTAGLPRFRDVDTTPALIGETLYVGSFAGGLYAMQLRNGTIEWREPEATGITSLQAVGDKLLVMSADQGVSLFDPRTRRTIWRRRVDRGAPSAAAVTDDGIALYGESAGSLLAIALEDGRELTRVESGYGFTATPAISRPIAAVISNTGNLFVLDASRRRVTRASAARR